MSKYVLVHMCMEHCGEQSGLLLTIETERISKDDFPLHPEKQVFFENPKLGGVSSCWVVMVYDTTQNQIIQNSIASSECPSFI